MARQTEQVYPHFLDIDRYFADGLGGIGVEQDAALLAQFADVPDGLQNPDFVVGRHDAD